MSLSYVIYTSNGSQTQFAVPFPYLDKADVLVSTGGTDITNWSWLNASTITLTAPATAGVQIKIRRSTDVSVRRVDFVNGSTLSEQDLDEANLQWFYLGQECKEQVADEIARARTMQGNLPPGSSPANDNGILVFAGGGTAAWQTPTTIRNILGLVPGNGDGQVPILTPTGLPAVSGVNLTNVIHALKYIRVEEQQASGVSGGSYLTGSAWQTRKLNTIVTNDVGAGVSLNTSTNQLTLPGGKYRCTFRVPVLYIERTVCRLEQVGVGRLIQSTSVHAQATTHNTVMCIGTGEFTLGTTSVLQLDMAGSLASTDTNACGIAHSNAGIGINIYATLELWKIE